MLHRFDAGRVYLRVLLACRKSESVGCDPEHGSSTVWRVEHCDLSVTSGATQASWRVIFCLLILSRPKKWLVEIAATKRRQDMLSSKHPVQP